MTNVVPPESELPPMLLPDLLLFGAGGHARVVADAALQMRSWSRMVASDRDPTKCVGQLLGDIPLLPLATMSVLPRQLHVAIGHNGHRAREAAALGLDKLVSIIHPLAVVSPFARVGHGSFVAASAVLAPGCAIGMCGIINHGAVVDHDVQIGPFCHVAPHATLGGGVTLGQRVMIGAGATVLPGMAIADDVVVGAGAVVRSPLTEPGTYVGIPARKLK